jgi:hypothetical protein
LLQALLLLIAAISSAYAWSVSSPTGSSPDEPNHIYYAWGTITGQVLPWTLNQVDHPDTGKSLAVIELPEQLTQFASPSCYIGEIYTDECNPAPRGDGYVTVKSYMSRYPLAYYAITGLALKLGLAVGLSGFSTLILARIVSGMASYLLLGIAFVVLKKRFGTFAASIPALAILVPNAHFLMNSVNPNGFEIAGMTALAAIVVAVRHDIATNQLRMPIQITLLLVALVAGSIRPLSVAWAGLLLMLLLVPINGRRPAFIDLSKAITAFLGLVCVVLLSWFYWEATGTMTETSQGDISDWRALPVWLQLTAVVSRFGEMLRNGYGLLGWADTQLPLMSFTIWLLAVTITLVAFGVRARRSSTRAYLALLFLFATMALIVLESVKAGFGWQGRYWLPCLGATIALLAPSLQANGLSMARRRRIWLLFTLVMAALITHGFIYNFWRYKYGLESPFVRFSELPYPRSQAEWFAPGGDNLLLFVSIAGVISFLLYAVVVIVNDRKAQSELSRASLSEVTSKATI